MFKFSPKLTVHAVAQPPIETGSKSGMPQAFRPEPDKLVDWSQMLLAQNAPLNWKELLAADFRAAIRAHSEREAIEPLMQNAHLQFERMLERYGLKNGESKIHGNGDLSVQSFAVMLATRTPSVRETAGVMALATHYLDDKLDPIEMEANRMLFYEHRHDVREFFDRWGADGKLGHALAEVSGWQEGFYRGAQRIFYGALLAHGSYHEQQQFLSEYRALSEQHLSPRFVAALNNIRPLCYSFTNKTVCETTPLEGSAGSFDAAEVRSLCFAPMLLLANLPSEFMAGELRYFGEAPTVRELVDMVITSSRMMAITPMDYELFHRQLNFAMDAFSRMIPDELMSAYGRVERKLAELVRARDERVVCVGSDGNPIGTADKIDAHRKGLLHNAFSVFLFTPDGQMIVQQRADSKYHSEGLWTNACCGHPRENEDIREAAERRLAEELGVNCKLVERFTFHYREEVSNNLIENEVDSVYTGVVHGDLKVSESEIQDVQICSIEEIRQAITERPECFSPWFKIAFPHVAALVK